jgi:hypothetical protein
VTGEGERDTVDAYAWLLERAAARRNRARVSQLLEWATEDGLRDAVEERTAKIVQDMIDLGRFDEAERDDDGDSS